MDYNQMPFGYGFAPVFDAEDKDGYSYMSDDEKREYIERNRSRLSKDELDRLTSSLGEEEDPTSLFRGPSIG